MAVSCFYIITDRLGYKSAGYTSKQKIITWAAELSETRGDFKPGGSFASCVRYLEAVMDSFDVFDDKDEFLQMARQKQLLQELAHLQH